eukprot:gene14603-16183_t
MSKFTVCRTPSKMMILRCLFLVYFLRVQGISFPPNEYNYLKELYYSTNGSNWFDNTNWNFENISVYNPCLQHWYGVYAYCGFSSGGTTSIYLSQNNLVGRLPPVLANFTLLSSFYTTYNHLTGPFPSFINCPRLEEVDVTNNTLTGSLPENVFENSPVISYLSLSENYLNGTLPDVIYELNQLKYIYFDENLFSGTISQQLSSLTKVKELYLSFNRFEGKFPSTALMNMTELEVLFLQFNRFTGSILFALPSLPLLDGIYLSNNLFEGSFPALPIASDVLSALSLGDNSFTGSLPSWLCDVPQLNQLNISYNTFTGTFPSCFKNFTRLAVLSLGYNKLTGSIPLQTFSIPSLVELSMADNCFDGTIDDSICEDIAESLLVVNLNDLHSTKCDSTGLFASKQRSKGATVPRCLWELPSLFGLFLSANAFSGSIPSDIQMADTITTLSISHNYFSGSIPTFIQEHAFTYLDLSYNKFRGTVKDVNSSSLLYVSRGEGYWNITHNRISGSLSSVFENAEGVNMLEGNLFACSSEFGSDLLPKKDPGYSNYFCGSSQLDYASYLLAGTSGLLVVFCMIVMIVGYRECLGYFLKQPRAVYERLETLYKRHISLLSIFPVRSGREDRFDKLYRFCVTLEVFMRVCVRMFILIFVLLLPTYLIFYHGDEANYKYDFEYNWVQTSAYLTGRTAGAVLFVFWVLVIVVFLALVMMSHDLSRQETYFGSVCAKICLFFVSQESSNLSMKGEGLRSSLLDNDRLSRILLENDVDRAVDMKERVKGHRNEIKGNVDRENNILLISAIERGAIHEEHEDQASKGVLEYYLSYTVVLSINIIATFALNYYYLSLLSASSATFEFKVGVQIGLAMIKLFWNYCVVSMMIGVLKRWEEFRSETYRLRLLLLVWNTILAPCTAALFTDRLCFYEYFFGTSNLDTFVTVVFPDDNNSTQQGFYQESSIGLPFMYYYTCSSQILTSYIPVFLYTYAFLPFISIGLMLFMCGVRVDRRWKVLNKVMLALIPGILRPGHYEEFRKMIFAEGIMSTLVLHMNVLMTFGLQSPLLAFAVCVTIGLDSLLWRAMIVRFVKYRGKGETEAGYDNQVKGLMRDRHLDSEFTVCHDEVDQRMQVLNKTLEDEWFYLYRARWRIFYVSMLFVVLIVLDYSGDEIGLLDSLLWVGVSGALVVLVVRLTLTDVVKRYQLREQ